MAGEARRLSGGPGKKAKAIFRRAASTASLAACVLVGGCAGLGNGTTGCVPPGAWVKPGGGRVDASNVIEEAARHSIVLLGETHDNAEHHRWQLQVLAALHARHPDMVIGFEMFPRSVQPVLDRWTAGMLSESEFLEESGWDHGWRMDPGLYMPLFNFARMNRIPMRALNVDPQLRRAVAKNGFDAVPEDEREGVTRPAPPADAYVDLLLSVYAKHAESGGGMSARDDPGFVAFVAVQTLWDRAMAEGLWKAAMRPDHPLVVGILGRGHIEHGYGVPHQLRDLGVRDAMAFLPWNAGRECSELTPDLADAVFGVASESVSGRQ